MKKILSMLMMLAVAMAYTSCKDEVDDVFDKSSAERIAETLKADKQVLTSQQNGWLMKYYGNTSYGGYNMLVKFNEDNTVLVANEVYGANYQVTSHYKLEQSAGVVLSFDEYNEVFHVFSDPAAPLGIGTEGKGMEGDLEFRVLKATPDSVIMTGKKHDAKIVMTPYNGDWAEYLNAVAAVEENMRCANYQIVLDTLTMTAVMSYRSLTISTTDENDEEIEVEAPFIITEKGIEFYEPLVLKGTTITGFQNVDGGLDYPAFEDNGVILKAVVPPLNQQLVNTYWSTSMSNLGAYGQYYWDAWATNILPQVNGLGYAGTLTRFYVGNLGGGSWGIYMILVGYSGIVGLDYELVGDDEITLSYNAAGTNANGGVFFTNWLARYLVVPFGCNTSGAVVKRTFKLTADDIKNPSEITMVDEANEDNTIRLTYNIIANPLTN